MNKFENWFFLLDWTLIVAGFAGGASYVFRNGKGLGLFSNTGLVFTGIVTSYFLGEPAAKIFSIVISAILTAGAGGVSVTVPVPVATSGFLCGYGAQAILALFLGWLDKKKIETITDKENEKPIA